MERSNNDLLKPLTPEEKAKKAKEAGKAKKYTPVVPIPDDVPPFDGDTCAWHNAHFGKRPDHIYPYRLADNAVAMFIVRWNDVKQKDGTIRKEIRPYIYGIDARGVAGWRSQFLDDLPLYNLPELAGKGKDILFVEGEKTAEAAKILFPDYCVTTTAGGSNSAHKTDFSPVAGMSVLISPDCGEAGCKYGDHVYARCRKARARRIQRFDTNALSELIVQDGKVVVREEPAKENYDLADALEDGWTPELMAAHRDQFITVYMEKDCEVIGKYKLAATGVYELNLDDRGQEISDPTWICPYLKVTHQVSDSKGDAWSKLVTFYDPKGEMKTQILTNDLLAGDGRELREKLATFGFSVPPQKGYREAFNIYFHFSNPKTFATSVKKVGWHKEGIYVLPDKVYGDTKGQYIQQIKPHHRPQVDIRGDLKGWQDHIGRYAEGNSRLVLAIVTPLVAPFLTPLQIDGHIFNLYGNSSIGKSSALAVASSVTGFAMNSFLNTNNAFESIFVGCNDACVVIDEMGLARPDKLGDFVYTACNGKTKGRANQKGEGIESVAFRANGLVSAEKTLAGKMEEAHHKATAGQEVRFVDIAADAGWGFGIFRDTYGMRPQELSDRLRQASIKYRGTVFDALLEHLTSQTWEAIGQTLNPAIGEFKARHLKSLACENATGQIHRVLTYFATHAAVGEYCIKIGILPWEPDSVIYAYDVLFRGWLDNRGNTGIPKEVTEALDSITKLCQQQISRFDIEEHNALKVATSHSRAGTIKKIDGATVFCVFPQVFREEVMKGKDEKVILPALVKLGVLKMGENGKRTIATRMSKYEGPVKMYHLTPSRLHTEGTDNAL